MWSHERFSTSEHLFNLRGALVSVLKKGLESESLKIWTGVRLEYTVGLEYYITGHFYYVIVA